MWDLLGPGIKLVCPALADELFITDPPEKPSKGFLGNIFTKWLYVAWKV